MRFKVGDVVRSKFYKYGNESFEIVKADYTMREYEVKSKKDGKIYYAPEFSVRSFLNCPEYMKISQ